MTQLEDSLIIDLFFERSERAIGELDKKYGAAVRKTAANLLHDAQDAEECVNDAYLGVWNSIPPHRPEPLIAFVCKIARNLAAAKYHSRHAKKRDSQYDLVLDELAECIPSPVDVETALEAKELSAAVSRFLETLPYEDRYCFVRRYWYVDSVAEIAAQMHSGSHRISVRLYRTREKLRRCLREEGLIE